MSSDMLDMITLADVAGLNADLNQRLLGADGQEWLKAYKRFLRKENPWVEAVPTVPVIQAALNRHIDCDAQPYVPNNWTVEEHQKGGQIEFDPNKVELYLSPNQVNGKKIKGEGLHKELKGKKVMNACALNHFLANPGLIPESWKGKLVFFWGTIYRNSGRNLYVRCLYWDGSAWSWGCFWLGSEFGARHCAAVSAS